MFGLPLKKLLTLLLLVGIGHAGLVHRRNAKETLTPAAVLDQDNKNIPTEPRIDQIPVTIIQEPEQELILSATADALAPTKLPLETNLQQDASKAEVIENDSQKVEQAAQPQLINTPAAAPSPQTSNIIAQDLEPQATTEIQNSESDSLVAVSVQPQQLLSSSQPQLNEDPSTTIITEIAIPLELDNSVKALASPEKLAEQQKPEVVADEVSSPVVAAPAVVQDELQRQVTQATPTQTTTQQNFVQQLIQNSPIGQFLSQFTGGQQQQGQQQADEPVTPAPTLPGFLNPAAAITSAQQAVQNAAQSVVNTTTQAFQGLQQFATNLGTQFQNTFSTLAGQQNQLSTADSTTTRPPGPIQSIVSSFVNPGNNQGTEGVTAAPGQQQQGPLQGILNFFQGGNRPQAANAASTVPPKEEPITPAGVDDKIESEQHDAVQAVAPVQQEPDTVNEVRNSAEVTNEDTSFEEGQGGDLIVVNDDAAQQDVTV